MPSDKFSVFFVEFIKIINYLFMIDLKLFGAVILSISLKLFDQLFKWGAISARWQRWSRVIS